MDANKIRRLELSRFTCFSQIELDFSEGINVFIGENGVGKTHLMKVLYYAAFLKGKVTPNNNFGNGTSLDLIFNIDHLKKLIRFGHDSGFRIQVYFGPDDIIPPRGKEKGMGLAISFKDELVPNGIKHGESLNFVGSLQGGKIPIYIPPAEMLSWYEGFQSLYERREISFDKTYYDLASALGLPKLKGDALGAAQLLTNEISQAIKADVFEKDGKFYVSFWESKADVEAPVVAQGINKLGQLHWLILNGSLTRDTILFWDEPEAGLNSKSIRLVANVLQSLANVGFQIFISTHDYLLAHQLSLMAEYRASAETKVPDMKFFALYQRNEKEGTLIESGPTLVDIQHNTILDEFSSFYDMEQALFGKPVKP